MTGARSNRSLHTSKRCNLKQIFNFLIFLNIFQKSKILIDLRVHGQVQKF